MLFRKNIEPACAYCLKGSGINETEIVCRKHGIVEPWWNCRWFRYDPYKREPSKPPKLKQVELDLYMPDTTINNNQSQMETILNVELK
jgi:hypothetical protein